MTDKIAELQNFISEILSELKRSVPESKRSADELAESLRKNLKKIHSAKQHRAIAALIDHNELFSNMIFILSESLIAYFSQLQTTYNEILDSNIKMHERGQDLITNHTKPSEN